MDAGRRKISRAMRCAAGLALGLVLGLGGPGPALAQCAGVPNCQVQNQTPFKINMVEIHRAAFTCVGEHPYVWNYTHSWSGDIPVLSVQDYFVPRTMKIEFWAVCGSLACALLDDETITVKLACSDRVSPDAADARTDCNTPYGADPKQPRITGSYQNYCGGGPVDACVAVWQERDPVSKQLYNCQNIEGVSTCQKCSG